MFFLCDMSSESKINGFQHIYEYNDPAWGRDTIPEFAKGTDKLAFNFEKTPGSYVTYDDLNINYIDEGTPGDADYKPSTLISYKDGNHATSLIQVLGAHVGEYDMNFHYF